MKTALLFFVIGIFGCNSSKIDSAKKNNAAKQAAADSLKNDPLAAEPACIKTLIEKIKAVPVTDPPSKLYSYNYAGKKVYYLPAVCCDQFSDLYDDSCKLIAHPDGGFTGRGDGKIKDFEEKKTDEKLLWQDKRKN